MRARYPQSGASDAPRRAGLSLQAGSERRNGGGAALLLREHGTWWPRRRRGDRGEPGRVLLLRHAANATAARTGYAGGPLRFSGLVAGRERYRQRGAGTSHPQVFRSIASYILEGQLRCRAQRTAGERTVWLRTGSVYWGQQIQARQV